MESKHTQSWYYTNEGADDYGHTLNVRDEANKRIASVVSNSMGHARLIAAAPEMLEALKLLTEQFYEMADSDTRELMQVGMGPSSWHQARQAIAKAEGRE